MKYDFILIDSITKYEDYKADLAKIHAEYHT
jgi:hypothetical protein